MSERIDMPEIDLEDVCVAMAKFDRGSTERAILRMLASGLRVDEIVQVADTMDRVSIRRIVAEAFPEKDISPHEFRKVLCKDLISGGLDRRTAQLILDHHAEETTSCHGDKEESNKVRKALEQYEDWLRDRHDTAHRDGSIDLADAFAAALDQFQAQVKPAVETERNTGECDE